MENRAALAREFTCQVCGRVVHCPRGADDSDSGVYQTAHYGEPPKLRTFCSERCLAELIRTYWANIGSIARVEMQYGFARLIRLEEADRCQKM